MRIALIVSSYHAFITERLEHGARAVLREAGLADVDVMSFAVPGAYELPQVAARVASSGEWSAIVCLGCLIRGETPHFDYIAQAASHGIMRAAQDTGVPMAFGVLTTSTAEEALARAGDGPANKGREAAAAALEMAKLYARLNTKESARERSGASGAPRESAPGGVQPPSPGFGEPGRSSKSGGRGSPPIKEDARERK